MDNEYVFTKDCVTLAGLVGRWKNHHVTGFDSVEEYIEALTNSGALRLYKRTNKAIGESCCEALIIVERVSIDESLQEQDSEDFNSYGYMSKIENDLFMSCFHGVKAKCERLYIQCSDIYNIEKMFASPFEKREEFSFCDDECHWEEYLFIKKHDNIIERMEIKQDEDSKIESVGESGRRTYIENSVKNWRDALTPLCIDAIIEFSNGTHESFQRKDVASWMEMHGGKDVYGFGTAVDMVWKKLKR